MGSNRKRQKYIISLIVALTGFITALAKFIEAISNVLN